MPLRLADLTNRTRTAVLDYDGDRITMQVRYQMITPRLLTDLLSLQDLTTDADQKLGALADQLATLVVSWDLQDVDGGMYPIDAERFKSEFPVDLLSLLLNAAVSVMSVGEA